MTGFMGCGKSTVAAALNRVYGLSITEMDEVIAVSEGMSVSDIFAAKGEEYFRGLETELLKNISKETGRVISCGGGAILRVENVKIMKECGRIVYLTASPETVLKRVRDNDDRPLLRGRKTVRDISRLMDKRKAKYEAAADIIVATDDKMPEEIAREIMERREPL